MTDIVPTETTIAEGACSDGVTIGGKSAPRGPAGSRQDINDYTGFLAGDADMQGDYFGYDGPCPPWNDEIMHHYHSFCMRRILSAARWVGHSRVVILSRRSRTMCWRRRARGDLFAESRFDQRLIAGSLGQSPRVPGALSRQFQGAHQTGERPK